MHVIVAMLVPTIPHWNPGEITKENGYVWRAQFRVEKPSSRILITTRGKGDVVVFVDRLDGSSWLEVANNDDSGDGWNPLLVVKLKRGEYRARIIPYRRDAVTAPVRFDVLLMRLGDRP